jgi:hypothetical protein
MARSFSVAVMQCLSDALRVRGWDAKIDPSAVEVEASRCIGESIEQTVSFTEIYSKRGEVCFQAGIGVRIQAVNDVLGRLRECSASGQLTAYALLPHLVPKLAKLQGYCFRKGSGDDPQELAEKVVDQILSFHEVQQLLADVRDVNSFIAAVEQKRWPFVSVEEQYIAALIVAGRIADAVRAAVDAERSYRAIVLARGLAVRDADLVFLKNAKKMVQ